MIFQYIIDFDLLICFIETSVQADLLRLEPLSDWKLTFYKKPIIRLMTSNSNMVEVRLGYEVKKTMTRPKHYSFPMFANSDMRNVVSELDKEHLKNSCIQALEDHCKLLGIDGEAYRFLITKISKPDDRWYSFYWITILPFPLGCEPTTEEYIEMPEQYKEMVQEIYNELGYNNYI